MCFKYQYYEKYITFFMISITIVFLALNAIVIQYLQNDDAFTRVPHLTLIVDIILKLWLLFPLERLFYLLFCPRVTPINYINALLIITMPPTRFAARRCHRKEYIWYFGWQPVDKVLCARVEKNFLYGILVVCIFMLPFWMLEIFSPTTISENDYFYHITNLGNATVWGLFVAEFMFAFSMTKKKGQYLLQHWLELLIILLPMLALARFIQVGQYAKILQIGKFHQLFIARLAKFQRLLNLYRARSTINRAVRILTIINAIHRWQLSRNPEKYLSNLREKIQDKEEELQQLKAQYEEAKKEASKQ